MSKYTPWLLVSKRTSYIILLVAALLLLATGWLWWHDVYQNSDRVFWGMVSNNLATSSVTKHSSQQASGQTNDQYTQLQFGVPTAARGLVTVKEGGTTVKSETIGTQKNDFSRYIAITTTQKTAGGKAIDTSKVLGIWGKTPENSATQYFQQGVLGIVLFGNLNSQQRQSLVNQLREKNVYKIGSVKSSKVGARAVYTYKVDVNPQALVGVLAQYAKYIGLGDIGLDPSQYAGAPAVNVEFTVDKLSRQITSLHYASSNLNETYMSQGLDQPISLPTKTIPVSDLQGRVQQSLQ